MDAATTLAAVKAAGGTFGLSEEGQLVIDFGEAEVEQSLLEALHTHAAIFRSLLGAKPLHPAGPEPVPFRADAAATSELSAKQLPPPPAGELLDEVTVAGNVVPFRVWQPGQLLAGDTIGIDTETEVIDLKDPSLPPPSMVLATATDGSRGFYVSPANIADFIKAHPRACFVMHNAPFDTEVIDQATAGRGVMLPLYDANRVADTMQMERLLELASSGEVPQFVSLDKLARKYLGVPVEKQLTDESGTDIRTGFGRYLGQPLEFIPAASRTYAAGDTVATWMVWQHQKAALRHIKAQAPLAYGYTTEEALEQAWAEYGPLSLHVQVKATMLCKVLWRRGLRIDQARREEVQKQLRRLEESAALKLGMADIYVPRDGEKLPKGVPSVQTAMRRHIEAIEEKLLADGTIAAPFPRTESGKLKMDAEQQRAWVEQGFDEVVVAYAEHCRAKKYRSTYCTKMARPEVHPSWRNLKVSGRFSCVGELAVQTLPKCGNSPTEMSLRRCIVPAAGHLFVIVDFAQLEVVALAAALEHQLHYGHALADVIRAGQDVHAAIASQMFPDRIGPVSSQERKRVKPITFGLPAGMGAAAIQRNAKASYGVELTVEQVEGIISAYKSLAPELVQHLAKTRDPGVSAMRACGLKSKWQGWQLLRLLGGDATNNGKPLPPEEVERLWVTADQLKPLLPAKSATQRRHLKAIEERKPSPGLAAAVRRALTPQAGLNMSGRLRANCSFTEARNNIFQSIAADGAILACWKLFRLGYDLRLFLHDEIVTQVPDDGRHGEHVKIISEVMIGEMSKVLKGLPVGVQAVVSRSFSARDKVVNDVQADGRPKQLRQGLPFKPGKPRSAKGLKVNKPAIDPSWLPEGDLPF
jgi:DNA polymerase I